MDSNFNQQLITIYQILTTLPKKSHIHKIHIFLSVIKKKKLQTASTM